MKQPLPHNPFIIEEDSSFDLKQELFRYLRFWPWFIIGLIACLIGSYFYLRYAPRIYQTNAKVKILDEGKGLEIPSSTFVFRRSNINLENEIEILRSYRILEQVVVDQNLTSVFYRIGNVKTAEIHEFPFAYEQIVPVDSIHKGYSFDIEVKNDGFEVINTVSNSRISIPDHDSFKGDYGLPFSIQVEDRNSLEDILGQKFKLQLISDKSAILKLRSTIVIEPIGKESDLLQLSLKGESAPKSELILNSLVNAFNKDGIKDRQLVSQRTIDFIDDRFEFLGYQLDSIEVDKKDFKQSNDLVYIETDTELSLQKRSQSDEEVFRIENQLAVANLLDKALKGSSSNSGLLPANIGLDNNNINYLIDEYNKAVLDNNKLISSGGANNPAVRQTVSRLQDIRNNINQSLNAYKEQLQLSQRQLRARNQLFRSEVSRIPEKEKLLRAIERQQKIKESLYLLLLQKREEAAINLAITEPSIKVVDYALSSSLPISPKPKVTYMVAILAGLLIPFGILYILFMFDTKLHGKRDIERLTSDIPIAAEIPKIDKKKNNIFSNPNDRSALAESFRILSSNVNYILPQEERGRIVYCTSTIKGEGKTFVSLNLSLALSSLNKKVLLIGADLRNPQLHSYINEKKDKAGLSNFLHDVKTDWKDLLIKGFDSHPNHDILISGSLPPNPAHLLTNGRFEMLLEEAKGLYDYIIVDTAPTILVTDTLLISQFADATLYITRANFTEKNLLDHSLELHKNKKLKNLTYVINSVGETNRSYGYNYGYKYGYTEA